jgi:hypothetical protein
LAEACEVRVAIPPPSAGGAAIFVRGGRNYIILHPSTDESIAIELTPIVLLEGMAVAAKAETLGDLSDIEEKYRGKHWQYVAAYDACRVAAPHVDPIVASKLLCDVALCSPDPSTTFVRGLVALSELPPNAARADIVSIASVLFANDCQTAMTALLAQVEQAFSLIPDDHRGPPESWAYITLRNVLAAVRLRLDNPTLIATCVYHSGPLNELADMIGTPVLLTNDGRLTLLSNERSPSIHQAIFMVRTLTQLCNWIVFGGPTFCLYAGCPGCPPERVSKDCYEDVRQVIALGPDVPWCLLYSAASQLRIRDLLTRSLAEV